MAKKTDPLVLKLCALRYDLHQAGLLKTALLMDKVIDMVGWEMLGRKKK